MWLQSSNGNRQEEEDWYEHGQKQASVCVGGRDEDGQDSRAGDFVCLEQRADLLNPAWQPSRRQM